MSLEPNVRARQLATEARAASRALAQSSAEQRTDALRRLAAIVGSQELAEGMALANAADVEAARKAGQSSALVDRLVLDQKRLLNLARALEEIAAQPDPVGEVVERSERPNGLAIERVRAPLGVVLMIYEARPNVTADAAALCIRAGNAALLRGGSEAFRSNEVLVSAVRRALRESGLPEDCVQLVEPERALVEPLLQQDELIDLCIPRGGPSLIRLVAEKSRIPVIKHYQGVCHLFVARDADPEMAIALALNGKTQRPGVCNAIEAILIDEPAVETLLPGIAGALRARGVQLFCDERTLDVAKGDPAEPAHYGMEFLDLKALVCAVDGVGGALAHIGRYGSKHTEVVCTRDAAVADRFIQGVDASCTLWNASSRFNDGGELGLGAEIGISTSKLHAYGPMGARELTCTRFVVRGAGQVRT